MLSLIAGVIGLAFAIESGVTWNPQSCTVTGYDFTGLSYVDSYDIPENARGEACEARKTLNELDLKTKYDGNHARIAVLVEQLLAEEDCRPIWPVLERYRGKLTAHASYLDRRLRARFELAERTKRSVEVQRWFALMAAYNNACAGEDNQKHNLLDNETIDELLTPNRGTPTQVTRDGQEISDCSDVAASGSTDLKNFSVAVDGAEDGKFQFYSDVYGIPDRVEIKTSSGQTIYDTGCVGGGDEKGFLEFTVPASVKKVVISIVNTCEDPENKRGSAWELKLRCKSKQIPVGRSCTERRNELLERLKLQVSLTKETLDAEVNQFQCLMHLDDYVRAYLVGGGFIVQGKPNRRNTSCTASPEECEVQRRLRAASEQGAIDYSLCLLRQPSSTARPEPRSCGQRPDDKGSLLSVVSWAYCVNAPSRLDLQ